MDQPVRILILEDNPFDMELILRELSQSGLDYTAKTAQTRNAFLQALETFEPNLILADFSLPSFDGLTAMTLARRKYGGLPVIIVSGAIGEERAIETLKAGATDYVLKQNLTRLGPVVRRALREADQLAAKVRAEKESLRRSAELEAANRDLESFAYSVSHDLRAPLITISGFCDLIREDYTDKIDETGKEYLRRIAAGVERISVVIESMLKLARLGRRELACRDVDIGTMASLAIDELRRANPERKVDVFVQTELVGHCDPELMNIAVSNLIANAWKFTAHKESACIEVGQIEKEGEQVFFVRDNGAGFDMNQAAKLFMPFQRLHTETEFKGTGIGLAIVERVIRRHGGRIWAQGKPGQGAVFYFTLPTGEGCTGSGRELEIIEQQAGP